MTVAKYSDEIRHILKKIRFYNNKMALANFSYYHADRSKRQFISLLKKEMTKEQMEFFLKSTKNKNLIMR